MSEYALTVVGVICGAIGAIADITIVVLMILERPKTVLIGSQRRYWPWVVALLLVTIASIAPAYFIYRLTNPRQTVAVAPKASAAQESKGDHNARVMNDFIYGIHGLKHFPSSPLRKLKVQIEAEDASAQQASMLVGWFHEAGWTVAENGEPGQGMYIGKPIAYHLRDGITIVAPVNSADAEVVHVALAQIGYEITREFMRDNDGDYNKQIRVELGNLPSGIGAEP